MATKKMEEHGLLDKIELSNTLDMLHGHNMLKAYGNIHDICFVVTATFPGSILLDVLFKGDNHRRTLRAKWSIKLGYDNYFDSEGYLPDNGKLLYSVNVPCSSSGYKRPFSFTAAIFSDTLQRESGTTTALEQRPSTNSFQDDFETGAGSDVTLSASGRDFVVHKVLLSARSPVFRAMFTTTMQEQKTQRVKITDVEPEVLQEVLRYIYKNRVLNIDKLAVGLVYAADKYDLQGLKDLCEDQMCLAVTKDNMLDLLVAAHLTGCSLLKSIVTKFISSNVQEICSSQKWKEICNKYPELGADMFILSAKDAKK